MNVQKREVAKFFAGFEAFHALANGYFWLTGMTLSLGGYVFASGWHIAGTIVHAGIAFILAVYAWRIPIGKSRQAFN